VQTLLALVAAMVIVVLGAADWLGFFRGWTRQRDTYVFARDALAVPWAALYVSLLCLAWAARIAFGSDLPMRVGVFLGVIFMVIGSSAVAFERPRWALPPWYRRQLEQEAAAKQYGRAMRSKRHPLRRGFGAVRSGPRAKRK